MRNARVQLNPAHLLERYQARQYRRTHGRDSYSPMVAAAVARTRVQTTNAQRLDEPLKRARTRVA